jgi:hypothetical protein
MNGVVGLSFTKKDAFEAWLLAVAIISECFLSIDKPLGTHPWSPCTSSPQMHVVF